ncbi:Receptor-type tyrosine-protein phosphatase T [Mizuhopecten yessoensis]|uniref:protein-tyrosine-phosphatase n=2 Tax=Mizuhopecten yessoensis TaxID=6573 RepID=A0A210PNT5_MIZYE|nr:Receptor-type tyrosine-protein phosphatase T [Mizuhopecten yessoensis]
MDSGVCETDCYSGFEGPTCESASEDPVGPGPIAGAVGGAFVLIIIIAIVLFVIIRRRRLDSSRQRSSANIARKEIAESHIYINSISAIREMSDEDPEEPSQNSCNVYVNTEEVVKDGNTSDVVYCNSGDLGVAVSDLKSLVKSKMQNKAKAFKDEYASLPSGALHEHATGLLSENKPKNRFKATYPYDHSRVKLDTLAEDPNSDYINANYIDSMTQTAEYIATQGPRPGTIDDFWLMIWQQHSGKIVMLTNLVEGAKPKCSKYWPDEEEPLSTPHFNIVLDRKRVYASYVIQDLTITEKKTKSERQIHHFHFTTWPDHGTPDLTEIVVFHRRVKQYASFLTGKVVVHCSAGIGRTGTFIALDALVKYGRDHGRVDVMGYIRTMRKDRMNMVQTSDQYIAIHHMLIEAFDMPDTLIPKMRYHTTLASLSNGAPTHQTKIRKEYQLTQTLKPAYTQEDFEGALLEENRNKNYTISVLAVDKFRAYLKSQSKERTDYINAVVVPSYTSRTGYIVTQTPLEETVVDLLTMMKDNYFETIVIIENDFINWMPPVDEVKTFGEFTLLLDRKSTYIENLDLLEVTLEHRTDDFLHKICVFHLSGWDNQSSDVPEQSSLLQLLELVNGRRKSDKSIPTLVMCRDGYSQSGMFCCISNAREQLKMDEEVDVFQITRQLLVRRPEFIINFEQYQCVYRMIKEYLDSTALYMN